ncbi:MAG TPA: amino-acid N-acetyltransferase [Gammaproteobacteria bacterium]|nr:amino-acid N-acetyltransferase [Gammaproteobacteria bacterium]
MTTLAPPDYAGFVRWMREASPYLRAHRGQTFVVYLGGEAIAGAGFPQIVQDLALLCGIGVKLVVVHGARPQVEARLARAGIATRMAGDLRVTDGAALAEVKQAVAAVRFSIEAQFAHATGQRQPGGGSVRILGGNFVVARPAGVIGGIDLQFTGELRRIDSAGLRAQLEHADLVLLSPLGHSPTGELFSLNGLELATAVAAELGAGKLVIYTQQPEVRDSSGRLRRQLTPLEMKEEPLSGPPAPVLAAALRACKLGVRRVHLVASDADGALLLELFTRDGVGTLLSDTPFDQLRRATIDDVGGILDLIEPLEAAGVLVKRSREKLEQEIDHFTVMVRDGLTVACGAVYPYLAEGMAELACIAVRPDYRSAGFGASLIAALERRAGELGIDTVFVLTTQATHWFQEHGYVKQGLDSLPMSRQALYNWQRNSQVLVKRLGR